MRDPHISNAAPLFPFLQRCELCVHIDKVMDLHQVDSVRAQKRHGTFGRLNSALLATSPNFGREKQLLANPKRGG